MSLYLRKMMKDQLDLSRSRPLDHHPDWYEEEILDAMTEDDADSALGRLTVVCADVLEQLRRTDPTYGLKQVPERALEDHGSRHGVGEFPTLCEYCARQAALSGDSDE